MNRELPPPGAANYEATEILRVWLIDGLPTYVITPDLWRDPSAWGLVIADIIKHLKNAYDANGINGEDAMARIKAVFDVEWDSPS